MGHSTIDVSKDKAHKLLGHSSREATIESAKWLGWKLTGTLHKCESYYTLKAKQKAVPKQSNYAPATKLGERLYLNLSKIKKLEGVKSVGKANWLMIVVELTGLKFSTFYQTKNGIIKPTCAKLQELVKDRHKLTCIRCDNTGENKKLESRVNSAI